MELIEDITVLDFDSGLFEDEFNQHYGLLVPEQTVLVRAFSDDSDDRMLAEIRPKFIVMFEPSMEFVRRIEASLSKKCLSPHAYLPNRCIRVVILDLVSEFIIWCTATRVRSISILLEYEERKSLSRG